MGSFNGHVLPGTLFLAVGLWRVWSSVARFAADPPAFRVRTWNPLPKGPRLLELYLVAGGAFLDMCLELGGGILAGGARVGPDSLIYLEHAGMLLMFFLFGALALLSQKTRSVATFLHRGSAHSFLDRSSSQSWYSLCEIRATELRHA
jgi:hypothetical protein